MLTITKPSPDRVDIDLDGRIDADIMRAALDDLIAKSQGVKGGRMLYRIRNFELPTLGAIGPESSRRGRGLAVWATLKAYGREGHRRIVEHCLDLAQHARRPHGRVRRAAGALLRCLGVAPALASAVVDGDGGGVAAVAPRLPLLPPVVGRAPLGRGKVDALRLLAVAQRGVEEIEAFLGHHSASNLAGSSSASS